MAYSKDGVYQTYYGSTHDSDCGSTCFCLSVYYGSSATKCGYVAKLAEMADYPLHLYGNGLDRELSGTAQYHGAFPPDELPAHLEGAFGLVWDGPSVETCDGPMGRYLGYNNPHKVSLYLAAGMPVIVWSKSALAPLVEENGIGIAVNELSEITEKLQRIELDCYVEMKKAAEDYGQKVQRGVFLKQFLIEI